MWSVGSGRKKEKTLLVEKGDGAKNKSGKTTKRK